MRGSIPTLAGLSVLVTLTGCSLLVDSELEGKGGGRDAGPMADGDPGGACDGAPDGESCGEGLICLSGACRTSVCGDGFVDTAGGEDCEDGNEESGDGCEPELCIFTCADATVCDDGNPCNGAEDCGAENVCVAGTPLSAGDACMVEDVPDGVCSAAGTCVPRGCGDGVMAGEEECDDGNLDPDDGCEPDCTFSCEADEDCADGAFCNGDETCDVASHVCQPGTEVVCEPSDACHTSTCSDTEGMCVEELIDADMDGEAATTLGECGTDCDDSTAERAAGNTELCGNGIDDDCDPSTSDAAMTLYYPDCDDDGYAVMGASGLAACMEPADCGGCSCTARAPTSNTNADCSDLSADARPGQSSYFGSPIPSEPSSTDYDYNCDGSETRQVTCVNEPTDGSCPSYDFRWGCTPLVICTFPPCCSTGGGTGGWTGSSAPSCGSSASYSYCRPFLNRITGAYTCLRTTITRQQLCR